MKGPAAIFSRPWAIEPSALQELINAAQAVQALPQMEAQAPARRGASGRMFVQQQVAVIPVHGVLMKRPGFLDSLFGATSTEEIAEDLAVASAEESVKAIVLEVDSPGGTVDGTQELANLVFAANLRKPVHALGTGAMASAAYWIAAAADSVWVSSDTSMVGSIGVLAKHLDISQLESRVGVKTTEVYAGKYKTHGSRHAPLTEEAKGTLQAQVDYLYTVFVNDIAKFRGVSAHSVLETMADGRIFIGEQATRAGLADGKATLGELTARLAAGAVHARRPRPAHAPAAAAALAATLMSLEERIKAEWDESAAVRGEFTSLASYSAWRRLEESGRVHEPTTRSQ